MREVTPGSAITLCYRALNVTSQPSPAALVRFIVPPEIELAAEPVLALPTLAPGTTTTLRMPGRIARPLPDGTLMCVQAALEVGSAPASGTNRVELRVHSAARVDGPCSMIRIEPTDETDVIAVVATIVNDGDDAVHDLRLVVPPPAGTRSCTLEAVPEFALAGLQPGMSVTKTYLARLTNPPLDGVRVCDAAIFDRDLPRATLPPSNRLTFAPASETPSIVCTADGRRTHVEVRASNRGWGRCPRARLELTWPPGFTCATGSLTRDGAPQRARFRALGATLDLAGIDARAEMRLTFDLYAGADAQAGTLGVTFSTGEDERGARADLAAPGNDDVRLIPLAAARDVADTASLARVPLELWNAGYRTRTVTFAFDGAAESLTVDGKAQRARLTIAPGERRMLEVCVRVPNRAPDAHPIAAGIFVCEGAQRLARGDCSIVARNRVWIGSETWLVRAPSGNTIVVSNRGATAASDAIIHVADGESIAVGTIGPRETVRIDVPAAFAARASGGAFLVYEGGTYALAAVRAAADAPALDMSFEIDARVRVGEAHTVRLHATSRSAIEKLTVRVPPNALAVTLAGSLRVNDCALPDRADGPAIHSVDGLVLHAIPPETPIVIAWSILAHAALEVPTAIDLLAHASIDGISISDVGITTELVPQTPFAIRESNMPFFIEGFVFDMPPLPEVSTRTDPAFERAPAWLETPLNAFPQPLLTCDLSSVRRTADARFLRGATMPGLISHLFSMRALFPDAISSYDPVLEAKVIDARDAVRAVLDRLYVKMRIPDYDLRASDYDDAQIRRACGTLFAQLGEDARAKYFVDASTGDPAVWSCIAALVPLLPGDDAIASAWNAYAAALEMTLTSFADMPDAWERELTGGVYPRLDDARATLIDLLERDAGVPA